MLEDRDYMRRRPSHAWSITTVLSVILVVVFALQCINDVYFHTPVEYWLALTPACLEHGWVWQLITFQFLHANLWHIAGNLLVFWWAGHYVENVLGKKRFLIAMFGCGAIGGLLQALLMILFPMRFGLPVVGASAGVAGLFAIYALMEKDSEVRLYFVLPIRAITLLWIFGIISFFFTVVPTPREMTVAHAAHLGGLLAGVAWVKLGWHRDYVPLPWEDWFSRLTARRWFARRPKKGLITVYADKSSAAGKSDEDLSAESLKAEVDAILDKISAHGIQSLTDKERKTLEAARAKMANR